MSLRLLETDRKPHFSVLSRSVTSVNWLETKKKKKIQKKF